MRSTRRFSFAVVGLTAVVALAACGSSSAKQGTAKPETNSHGMTAQEMKCMDTEYAAAHAKACPDYVDPAATAKPLALTADGLIDATKVDLSGIDGVSAKQQADSEALLASTIKTLPKWTDYNQAVADGFESIGDGLTGEEHVIHWDWIDDDVILDPTRPESLVYKYDRATGTRTLEAAMFIFPKEYTLDNPPSIVSPLVQMHIHDNLCFTAPPAPKVRGLTKADGTCSAPLVKFNPNPMIHVWIRPNECGAFAALNGIGAGQVRAGETKACAHGHGRVGL